MLQRHENKQLCGFCKRCQQCGFYFVKVIKKFQFVWDYLLLSKQTNKKSKQKHTFVA